MRQRRHQFECEVVGRCRERIQRLGYDRLCERVVNCA